MIYRAKTVTFRNKSSAKKSKKCYEACRFDVTSLGNLETCMSCVEADVARHEYSRRQVPCRCGYERRKDGKNIQDFGLLLGF